MVKPLLADSDESGGIAEQAVRAQQAEAASSAQAAAQHQAAPASILPAQSVREPVATSTAAAGDARAPLPAASIPALPALTKAAPSSLSGAAGQDGAAPGPSFSAAQMTSASAIMNSAMKDGPLAKFDTQLAALELQNSNLATSTLAATSQVHQFAGTLSVGLDGRQYVTIDASAADGNGANLLAQLDGLGLQHGASYGAMASGQIAVGELGALANVSDLRGASEAGFMLNVGAAQSQAVHAEAADTAQTTYSVDGTGLKIGILSDSFNTSSASDTEATDVTSNDLPQNGLTSILHDDPATGADEGRAMAQLVHDIAPGAAIEFATAEGGEANFASNIAGLVSAGAKVIVDDITYFDEPFFQNGAVTEAVESAVSNGVAYFSSAGNDGASGWLGPTSFATSKVTTASLFTNLNTAPSEDVQLQQFASGEDYLPLSNLSYAKGATPGSFYVVLQWNDPDADTGSSSHGPASDLDLFVYDATTSTVIGYSAANNITNGEPIEVATVNPVVGDDLRVYVGATSLGATPPSALTVIARSDGLGWVVGDTATDANAQGQGSSYGHNAAAATISVGAASYFDTPYYNGSTPISNNGSTPVSEYYSSESSVVIYYDDSGNRLATPQVLSKIDLTAVDGVDTTFFGQQINDGDSFPNFFGTSAAAPDAAAVALLMLQVNANLTPDDIRHLEMDSAIPMANQFSSSTATGDNSDSGSGLIQADAAVGFAKTGAISNAAQHQLYGTHLADAISAGGGAVMVEGFGGADQITAGSGADTFVYQAVSDSTPSAYDTITGFKTGTDEIDLRPVDDGTVFLSKPSDGSTTVYFDLVSKAYQGEIHSKALVASGDLLLVSGTKAYTGAIGGTTTSTAITDVHTATPFSGVTVADNDPGATNITATVTLSAVANGHLSDPNASTDGGVYKAATGVYTVSGTASAVQAGLEALVFTPTAYQAAPGSTVTTTFTVAFSDGDGGLVSDASTTVTATATTPPAAIALSKVEGSGTVNHTQAAAGVILSGTTTNVPTNQAVTLTVHNAGGTAIATFHTSVQSDGTYSVTVPAAKAEAITDGTYTVTASTAGAQASSQPVVVHETLPTVTLAQVEGNDVVNASEAAAGVPLSGTTTGVDSGTTVHVKVTSAGGATVGSFAATDDGSGYSLTVPAATARAVADGTYTLTASVTDAYGNAATPATQTVTVHETLPAVSIAPVGGNNVVTPADAAEGVTIAGSTTGVTDGTTVHVGVYNAGGARIGGFTASDSGDAYSVYIPPSKAEAVPAGTYTIKADVIDSYGNPANEATDQITVQAQSQTGQSQTGQGQIGESQTGAAGLLDTRTLTESSSAPALHTPDAAPDAGSPASAEAGDAAWADSLALHLGALAEAASTLHAHAFEHLVG